MAGGAIRVLGGELRVDNSSFVENEARTGGAVHVDNPLTVAILERVSATGNKARETGGAFNVLDGYLRFQNSSLVNNRAGLAWVGSVNNSANSRGHSVFRGGGQVTYLFPAPLGHWVKDTISCEWIRLPCTAGDAACVPSEQPYYPDDQQPCVDLPRFPELQGRRVSALSLGRAPRGQ